VDYLDAVRDQILAELRGRPLSVMRILRGQEPFMQKNVPKYTPPWVRTIRLWAESSRREVSYALCDDRRTLLWFANQRAVEYHPTLATADRLGHPTHLIMDIDPPIANAFELAVKAAHLVRQALDDAGLAGAVKTSGAKGVHVFVPIDESESADDMAAATRAIAARAERIDPALATTAFVLDQRHGKVFLDSTRARPWCPRTVRACGPVCRCRSRWPGTNSTMFRRPISPCTTPLPCSATATPGRTRCRRHSGCPRTWSPRAAPFRWPGCRRCTRASAAREPVAPKTRAPDNVFRKKLRNSSGD
jgi:DNA ligase D-like protein (predicted polymerase)